MGQQSATGSGPNKKLAKRAAAEVQTMFISNKIMLSKMEVASQHCYTVENKTKDILDTVKIERIC